MPGGVFILTLAAALGSALVGGVFFAFSAFVMPALARLRPRDGIVAMQSINVTAEMPGLMTVFVGAALASLAAIAVAIVQWHDPYAPYLLAAALLYLVGALGLTAGYHVPRNNALAGLDPEQARDAERWTRYLREWTAGNHVRAAAGIAAAGLFVAAIRVG